MVIVGDHPETGLRVVLERAPGASAPFVYTGFLLLPAEKHAVTVHVDGSGEVSVSLEAAPAALREKVRLLVRAACKGAGSDGEGAPPPLRITRWRGEK